MVIPLLSTTRGWGQSVCALSEHHEPTEDFVTVTVARRVVSGQEATYEAWAKGVSAASAAFPGYLGVTFLRPSIGYNQYTIIYRFDTQVHADDWSNSDSRKEWIDRLDGIVEGEGEVRSVTGLETWFDLPTISVEQQPVRWRMCLVLMLVVFSLISAVNWALSPVLDGLGFYARTAVVVAIQVTLMTYLVMPRVTALLKGRLYR